MSIKRREAAAVAVVVQVELFPLLYARKKEKEKKDSSSGTRDGLLDDRECSEKFEDGRRSRDKDSSVRGEDEQNNFTTMDEGEREVEEGRERKGV